MATTKTITKNLGGNRLGSGSKNNIKLHSYNRSNHDLSKAWRSSMNCGTLVPFMKYVGLPGDTFSIDLKPIVRTIPTIGPLYGAYKLQMDVFSCPIRLYNGLLHNNMTKIGLNMSQVKLPQMNLTTRVNNPSKITEDKNLSQISPSSILHYLGIKGIGDYRGDYGTDNYKTVTRNFNAVPLLAYWDIYKNYYANKQEDIGVFISKNEATEYALLTTLQERTAQGLIWRFGTANTFIPTGITIAATQIYQPLMRQVRQGMYFYPELANVGYELRYDNPINLTNADIVFDNNGSGTRVALNTVFTGASEYNGRIILGFPASTYVGKTIYGFIIKKTTASITTTKLEKFELGNIDIARMKILQATNLNSAVNWTDLPDKPYRITTQQDIQGYNLCKYPQMGLGIKTYQSDLLQNWLETEWIDGENGINQITAVDTSSGNFQIDALNLANKVYNMLNRIAVSGGTYEDWQEAVYSTDANRRAETPVYKGGMACEIMFEEVVSTAPAEEMPLGSLAGKGRTIGERGGHIEIRVDEPSYIIGIVSITPRIDYSQGNDWDMCELETMDDLHKPALDGIGFEDLLQERAAWWGTFTDGDTWTKLAMGKTPAWMNYMTAVNETHGDFAIEDKAMWMTLNRRYEYSKDTDGIADLTTYIDPAKFNYTFADSTLEAQNFWVQIGIKCFARRVMSAKILPNL